MTRQYLPLRDKVVVKVNNFEKSSGGIIIQHKEMEKEEGEIVAVGASIFYDTNGEDLKPGDKVAFARYAGKVLEKNSDGTEIRTMRDIDLLCKISD